MTTTTTGPARTPPGSAPRPGRPARPPRWRAAALLGTALVLLGSAAITMAASPAPSTSPDGDTAEPRGDRGWRRAVGLGPGLFDGFLGFAGPERGIAGGSITITAIDGPAVTLATVDGWTRTIQVTDETRLRREGETITLADLAVGDRLRFAQTEEDGVYTVTVLEVVLPRTVGQVTSVDGSGLTLETPDGTSVRVTVGAGTSITLARDDDATLSEIEVGMIAVVAGETADDGSIAAESIRAGSIWGRLGRGRGGHRGPFGGPSGGPWWPEDDAAAPTPEAETSAG